LHHWLSLIRCAIPEGIVLTDARTRRIDLSGSYTQGLDANGLTVEGDLFLSGLNCTGAARLMGACIERGLSCRGARLDNPNGYALIADGMTVGENVLLDERFHATGAVRLRGARIEGALVCRGARFENPNASGIALDPSECPAWGDRRR